MYKRQTRDITGPLGTAFSNAWDQLDEHGDAYMKSFGDQIPPSLFVSERDRVRMNQPMPVVERCIEDWRSGPGNTAATRPYGPVAESGGATSSGRGALPVADEPRGS